MEKFCTTVSIDMKINHYALQENFKNFNEHLECSWLGASKMFAAVVVGHFTDLWFLIILEIFAERLIPKCGLQKSNIDIVKETKGVGKAYPSCCL